MCGEVQGGEESCGLAAAAAAMLLLLTAVSLPSGAGCTGQGQEKTLLRRNYGITLQ